MDYDAFYCAVIEATNQSLRRLPLAVQRKLPQKQIIVTCNYEARRRGLHKLQLLQDAKRLCPELVIVLGEDLTRFRNASKDLHCFLRQFSWNGRIERLGFDEVWLDVTDQIDYNIALLNPNDLGHAYFCLSKADPTHGFGFDATRFAGNTYPHVRAELDQCKGYTASIGISTNKLLSKLVGSVNKPNAQTTLLPPYDVNAISFIDAHDVARIPGVGPKRAQRLRDIVCRRANTTAAAAEAVTAGDVRRHAGASAEFLEKILAGTGSPRGIGSRIWGLLQGVDDSDVAQVRDVPRQISIENSYIRLDTLDDLAVELKRLALSLLKRMHLDLLEHHEEDGGLLALAAASSRVQADDVPSSSRQPAANNPRWIAHPGTLRLSTRPRPPVVDRATKTRRRTFARTSRSVPLPTFVFSLATSPEHIAERLVVDVLLPLFRRLHPDKTGWNLSLVNVAVTNIADEKAAATRDIGALFKKQNSVLDRSELPGGTCVPPGLSVDPIAIGLPDASRDGAVSEADVPSHTHADAARKPVPLGLMKRQYSAVDARCLGSEDLLLPRVSSQASCATLIEDEAGYGCVSDEAEHNSEADALALCDVCGALMPHFAMGAHARLHAPGV